MKIVSWNIAGSREPWRRLLDMDADIALLQEAGKPPPEVAARIDVNPGPWRTAGGRLPWRAAVARLSERVRADWIETKSIDDAASRGLDVSHLGALAAATVTLPDGEPVVVVSMYAPWKSPHASTGSGWIVSDASAHRIVSDLSLLIGSQQGHRIIAAGDLNILHGHGEHGSPYWAARYDTVFKRMEALGLPFVGPQSPCGRQADPWPKELPRTSKNVPTYYSIQQKAPAAATRQLDFVFASEELADSLSVRALNEPDEWGPSDHCRIEIEVS